MNDKIEARTRRLDLAARAAWLYYIKRRTQDEIAVDLNVSRPNAQRLVALAITEGLIKFRLDHPLLKSMELGERLRDAFAIDICEIAPSVAGQSDRIGVTLLAAQLIETMLGRKTPQVIGVGTGRTLLEAVREVSSMERPDHKILSVVGNLTRDGRANPYDVVMRLADRAGAQCYPMPLPLLTDTTEERAYFLGQRGYRTLNALYHEADAIFLGVGSIGTTAALLLDGFLTPEELAVLQRDGAVGELRSWPFDASGSMIENEVTSRLTAFPLISRPRCPTILVASGRPKMDALLAALRGRFATGLVVDEPTAMKLLERRAD